jgi:TP901 family phage tail tape measure protein
MAINIPLITTFDAKGINRAVREFKKLDGGVNKSAFVLKNLNQATTNAFKSIAKVAGVLGVGVGVAIKSFASFDQALNQSIAIMGNVSDDMKKKMSDAARQMAKETTFSATQAAESFFFLASAGLSAEQAILALPKVARFAQAGMFDMAQATDLLTDAQSALGLTIRDDAVTNMMNLTKVSDVLVKANTLANASVQQFSEALTNKAGAAIKAVGMDIEEGVAVLAAFADQGIKSSEAGTQFGIILRDLQTKALANTKTFSKFGVSVFDSSGELRNMADIIGDVEGALKGQSDATKKQILLEMGFSDKSVSSMMALVGTSDAIRLYEEQLRSASGITEEIADKQLESLSSQLTLAKNALMDLLIQLGERFAPLVQSVTDFVRTFSDIVGEQGLGAGFKFASGELFEFLENLSATGNIIYGIVAAFVALKIAVGLATIATTLFGAAFMSTGIGLIVVAISAVIVAVGAMALKFQWFRDTLKDIWNAIVMFVQDYINEFLSVYEFFINKFIQGVNILISGYNKFNNVFGGTDIDPLKEVNYQLDLMGLLIDKNTQKTKQMNLGLGQLSLGDITALAEQAQRQYTPQYTPPLLLRGEVEAGTVKTMAERFKELTSSVQGYGKQLRTVNEAQKDFEQAPLDLKVAIEATAKAQEHFNKTLNGFGIESKEAIRATRNLEEAQRNSTRAGIGLADAQQAVIEAQKELTRLQTPASARSIQEAQDAITQATFDLADANKELTRAERRNKPRELELARIAQRDATNALADAQLELTTLQAGASEQEITDATEALTEAELSLVEAQLDAKEATEGVTAAQTLLDEAVNGAKAGTDAYTEALKLLTEAKEDEAKATDLVTTSTIALKDAKLALAEAENKVRISRGGMTSDQISNAERLTGVTIGNISDIDFSGVDFEALGRLPMSKQTGFRLRVSEHWVVRFKGTKPMSSASVEQNCSRLLQVE